MERKNRHFTALGNYIFPIQVKSKLSIISIEGLPCPVVQRCPMLAQKYPALFWGGLNPSGDCSHHQDHIPRFASWKGGSTRIPRHFRIGYWIYIYMDFRITKKPAKWKQEPLLWPFGATWTKQRSWDICKFGQGSYWLHRVLLLEKHVGCAKSTRYNVWWSCFVQDPSSSWNCVQYYFLEN